MKGILYVEESENALARAIIKRKDINLAIIRFSNCMNFSEKHTVETLNIPTFIVNKKSDFEEECVRLCDFLESLDFTIDVFYNDSEFNQIFIQKMARRLCLPGALSEYQAQVVRDKFLMKQFVDEIGLPCPKYRVITSFDDLAICILEWGFPFIIKWRKGVSSIEVYKVNDIDDINKLSLDYQSGKYMAEQYQDDKIWCIDAIVKNGKVISNLYTWLPYTNLSFAEKKERFTQLAVGKPQGYWKFNHRELTQLIISNLKLASGYLHLEVFVSDSGEPSICEFAWRTPGDHMLENFTLLYDCCVEDMLIDVVIDNEVCELHDCEKCVADVFLPLKDGKITKISSISDIKKTCEIINGEIFYHIGDEIISKHKYTDSAGWVQINADSIEEALNKLDQIYLSYTFEVDEPSYEKSSKNYC